MNIAEKLRKATSPLFTFELVPPLKGKGIDAIYKSIDNLLEFNPAYINMTSHAADIQYKTLPDGSIQRRNLKRLGKDEAWLRRELKARHVASPADVCFMSIDEQGGIYLQPREKAP